VHDFLTVGAPAPLQASGAIGFAFDADYFNHLALDYKARLNMLAPVLRDVGFRFSSPEGAYYIFADFSAISEQDDVTFAKWLVEEVGVATVPGSSFYSNKKDGRPFVRFAFCKKFETMKRAADRLAQLPDRVRR
jgi:aminotransferase